MSRRFILRLREGPLRHSIAPGYVYETIRNFATGGVAPWELSARDTAAGVKALVRNHKYQISGLAGNSYWYRGILGVRGLHRGMATTAARGGADGGFSVTSNVQVGCEKPKYVVGEEGADKSGEG